MYIQYSKKASRINKARRICKNYELVAAVNTNVFSTIEHLYKKKQISSNNSEKVTISYPVFGTHVLKNEWNDICAMIISM